MGLAASQARLILLTSRKSNLERDGQHISQERMNIANKISKLYEEQQNPPKAQASQSCSAGNIFKKIAGFFKRIVSPCSAGTHQAQPAGRSKEDIDKEIKALESLDRKLEMQLKNVDMQHNAVQTEADSVQKVIDKNIETGFKTCGRN